MIWKNSLGEVFKLVNSFSVKEELINQEPGFLPGLFCGVNPRKILFRWRRDEAPRRMNRKTCRNFFLKHFCHSRICYTLASQTNFINQKSHT